MEIIKAPNNFKNKIYVFLAGSIEMGKAEDWQKKVTEELSEFEEITILNPRRDDWDSSWVQSIENKEFVEQVEWELAAQEKADYIIMNFVGDTKSPISLLELGLFARSGKLFVCCPREFWRKGNVDIVCRKYTGCVPYENMESLISEFKESLKLKKEDNYDAEAHDSLFWRLIDSGY